MTGKQLQAGGKILRAGRVQLWAGPRPAPLTGRYVAGVSMNPHDVETQTVNRLPRSQR